MRDFDFRNFGVSFTHLTGLGYQVWRTLNDGVRDPVQLYRFYDTNGPNHCAEAFQ